MNFCNFCIKISLWPWKVGQSHWNWVSVIRSSWGTWKSDELGLGRKKERIIILAKTIVFTIGIWWSLIIIILWLKLLSFLIAADMTMGRLHKRISTVYETVLFIMYPSLVTNWRLNSILHLNNMTVPMVVTMCYTRVEFPGDAFHVRALRNLVS